MVWEVFCEFEAPGNSEEGIKTFKDYIEPERLANEIKYNGYKIYCCFDGDLKQPTLCKRKMV